MKNKINIVWFKRDLRLQDHEPLQYAIESDFTCILLYIFEPELISNDDSDIRHWRFVYQSLIDIRKKLEPDNSLTIFYGNSLEIFQKLSEKFSIQSVYSHQETGNRVSFDRDLALKKWFTQKGISWIESQCNGVLRGIKNRNGWDKKWIEFMHSPITAVNLTFLNSLSIDKNIFSVHYLCRFKD